MVQTRGCWHRTVAAVTLMTGTLMTGTLMTGALMTGALMAGTPAAAAEEIRVTNWAEYLDETIIDEFTRETGIAVVYDYYDSVEAIDAKLLAGNTGYDVVDHQATRIARLIPAGILQPIDKSKIPNLSHMMPEVMRQLAAEWDPDNAYIVPYTWGTHGVTYNRELVLETYPDAPIGSMDLVMDPTHLKEIARCGVSFLDSPTDVVPMALAHLGLSPNTTKSADYKAVEAHLLTLRPHIKTFDNYAYQRMPEKEFCVAVTWGPDGLLAMSGAREANTGVVLNFFAPAGEGRSNLWVDGWVIPADARNVDGAHKWLDFVSRPDIAARNTNFSWYASANASAKPLVDAEVTGNPASYPPPEDVAQMYTLVPLPQRAERARTRAWTNFKAGQ